MIKNYLNAKIDYSKNKDLKYYKSNSNVKTIETKKDELIESLKIMFFTGLIFGIFFFVFALEFLIDWGKRNVN